MAGVTEGRGSSLDRIVKNLASINRKTEKVACSAMDDLLVNGQVLLNVK